MLKWVWRAIVALVLLIVLAFGGGYAYLRRSLPQMDGTITVTGLSGPVDIIRDRESITHVFGVTRLDTFYGLGYARGRDPARGAWWQGGRRDTGTTGGGERLAHDDEEKCGAGPMKERLPG